MRVLGAGPEDASSALTLETHESSHCVARDVRQCRRAACQRTRTRRSDQLGTTTFTMAALIWSAVGIQYLPHVSSPRTTRGHLGPVDHCSSPPWRARRGYRGPFRAHGHRADLAAELHRNPVRGCGVLARSAAVGPALFQDRAVGPVPRPPARFIAQPDYVHRVGTVFVLAPDRAGRTSHGATVRLLNHVMRHVHVIRPRLPTTSPLTQTNAFRDRYHTRDLGWSDIAYEIGTAAVVSRLPPASHTARRLLCGHTVVRGMDRLPEGEGGRIVVAHVEAQEPDTRVVVTAGRAAEDRWLDAARSAPRPHTLTTATNSSRGISTTAGSAPERPPVRVGPEQLERVRATTTMPITSRHTLGARLVSRHRLDRR